MTSTEIEKDLEKAKKVYPLLANSSLTHRNNMLAAIGKALDVHKNEIFMANEEDIANAIKENLESPLLKRLKFDQEKLYEVSQGIDAIIALDDPLNQQLKATELDSGLELYRITCPIGLICMIFESRPDALIQMACLSIKSGNCIVLKGGSEAKNTNAILARIIHDAVLSILPIPSWLVHIANREDITKLLSLHKLVDLVIPRGSNEFVQYIMTHSRIPVMGHADGICHAYVHEEANFDMARSLVIDAKTQYVAVCNAIETLLIDQKIAIKFLPLIEKDLKEKEVIIYGCDKTKKIISCEPVASFATEYLDYKISIKIVDGIDEACAHIAEFGSKHTELIITEDEKSAREFMMRVDAASVVWNASTRFADGFRYGLGAEVGISTGKLHARGPVGLEGLITYKYKLFGKGHIVKTYVGPNAKPYTHKDLTLGRDSSHAN